MKPKRIIQIALSLFVAVSLVHFVEKERRRLVVGAYAESGTLGAPEVRHE